MLPTSRVWLKQAVSYRPSGSFWGSDFWWLHCYGPKVYVSSVIPVTTESTAPVIAKTMTIPNTTRSGTLPNARWPAHMPIAIPTAAKPHIHQDSDGTVEPMNHHRPRSVAVATMIQMGCKLAAKEAIGHRESTPKMVMAGPPIPA